jgi:hypothetical protein
VILAVASLLAAWNGYQATQWSNLQGLAANQANAERFAGTRAATTAGQQQGIDIFIFGSWLEATRAEDQELADFYRARFRAEFQPAFEAWLATQPLTNPAAPATPGVMPEYDLAAQRAVEASDARILEFTEQASTARQYSREYIQNTLYIAVALALAGFARTFTGRTAYKILLGSSAAMLLIGLISTLRVPIA